MKKTKKKKRKKKSKNQRLSVKRKSQRKSNTLRKKRIYMESVISWNHNLLMNFGMT